MTVSDTVFEAEELKDFLKNVCKAENKFGNHNSKSPVKDSELITSTATKSFARILSLPDNLIKFSNTVEGIDVAQKDRDLYLATKKNRYL